MGEIMSLAFFLADVHEADGRIFLAEHVTGVMVLICDDPKSLYVDISADAVERKPLLTQGRINAVRAAFKAGVKPSTIARQFGISPSAVKEALASKRY